MNYLKRHLSYANVAATMALVFAMSGGALAAHQYLITSVYQISPAVRAQLRLHGLHGPAGKPGANGAVGVDIQEGKPGPQGPTGPAGKNGFGVEGPPGPAGREGKEGAKGVEGATGPDLLFITEWCLTGIKDAETWVNNNVPEGSQPALHKALLGLLAYQYETQVCSQTH